MKSWNQLGNFKRWDFSFSEELKQKFTTGTWSLHNAILRRHHPISLPEKALIERRRRSSLPFFIPTPMRQYHIIQTMVPRQFGRLPSTKFVQGLKAVARMCRIAPPKSHNLFSHWHKVPFISIRIFIDILKCKTSPSSQWLRPNRESIRQDTLCEERERGRGKGKRKSFWGNWTTLAHCPYSEKCPSPSVNLSHCDSPTHTHTRETIRKWERRRRQRRALLLN